MRFAALFTVSSTSFHINRTILSTLFQKYARALSLLRLSFQGNSIAVSCESLSFLARRRFVERYFTEKNGKQMDDYYNIFLNLQIITTLPSYTCTYTHIDILTFNLNQSLLYY